MKSQINPTVGRIVHYVPLPGEVYKDPTPLAAVVVGFSGCDATDSEVNLKIWKNGPFEDLWNAAVKYDETSAPGTWHWPPR